MKRSRQKFKEGDLLNDIIDVVNKYNSKTSSIKRRKVDNCNNEQKKEQPDVIGKIKKIITCSITLEIFVWPISLDCGHTFEAYYLKMMDTKKQITCPLCRKIHILIEGRIESNYVLMHIIDELFPNYRQTKINENKKEYKKPKKKRLTHFGSESLLKANQNKKKNHIKWFNQLKKNVFAVSINNGWDSIITRNDTLCRYIELNHGNHGLMEFFLFLQLNGVYCKVENRVGKKKLINQVSYTFTK